MFPESLFHPEHTTNWRWALLLAGGHQALDKAGSHLNLHPCSVGSAELALHMQPKQQAGM
jgi:hypothetical protein